MVSRDELKEEPKTNVFSHNTARETEENYEWYETSWLVIISKPETGFPTSAK